MTTITYAPGNPIIRGFNDLEGLQVSTINNYVYGALNITNGLTYKDIIYSQNASTNVKTHFNILSSLQTPQKFLKTSFKNYTPQFCNVDLNGNVTWISDGLCEIGVTINGETRIIKQLIQNVVAGSFQQTDYVTGSLAKNIQNNIVNALNSVLPTSINEPVFNLGITARNASRAAIGFDLSASSANQFPVHLITPYHFICAAHVQPDIGKNITFIRNDNTTQTVTVANKQSGNQGDMNIGVFNTAVTGVTPYSFLPTNYANYAPSFVGTVIGQNNYYQRLPFINITGATGLNVRVLDFFTYLGGLHTGGVSTIIPAWTSPVISGDSGGPMLLPITVGSNTVMTICGSLFGATVSPSYTDYTANIQSVVNSLQSGQSLSYVNLSSYPTF